jgi:hypothetical protein
MNVVPRSRFMPAMNVRRFLGHHVESDRRFVEKHDWRIVQHGGRKVAAHALTERELTHGRTQKLTHLQQFGEVIHVGFVAYGRNAVDRAQEFERFDQRQIPIQLRALTEDDTDIPRVFAAPGVGDDPGDPHFARRRDENAGQHLNRGRFARAVRSDVTD